MASEEDSVPLLPDDLHQDALSSAAIELTVEDLFPRAEVELALGDGHDDLAAHDLAFHVGVGVVLAGAVMAVLAGRRVRGEFFKPLVVVGEQALFIVVDVDAGRYMRCPIAT